ncbi:Hypothetical protein A7982_02050 [Minicystis rosea]|nr:Hypothetical protein A7982_02050 [Minicystis rosea]
MSFLLTWRRERRIEPEDLLAAIVETGRALSLSFTARSASDVEEDDEDPNGSFVTLRLAEDGEHDLELAIRGPIPIEAQTSFTGHEITLHEPSVDTDWAPAYLFVLHVATLLGMVPEDQPEDDEGDFADEVRSRVEECLEDEIEETFELRVAATKAAVGPLRVEARREADGPVLDVRGAGTDLSIRLLGAAASLTADQLEAVLAAVRGEELESAVAEERVRRLAVTEPAVDPAHGGASVLRIWVDGVAGPARVLTASDSIDELELPEHADPAHVVCDLVHYLPNGQPMARRAELDMPLDEPVEKLWLIPTWCWTPAASDVRRVFEEIERTLLAPPQLDAEELTLERWLAAFAHITGRLRGLSARKLIAADAGEAALLPEGILPSEPVGVDAIPVFLLAIEAAVRCEHGWRMHEGLLLSGEWADDSTDDFVDGLVAMLGLPEPPEPAAPAPYDAYLATLNAAAESLGKEERLYVVPNPNDVTLIIKLHPRAFEELKAKGLLDAHLPSGPGVSRPGAWARLVSWWSKRFS